MSYDRKSNNAALNKISSNLNNGFYGNVTKKTITFTGSGGTGSGGSSTTVATVTGPVLASVVAVVTTSTTGSGNLSVGYGSTTGSGAIIAQTNSTLLAAGEIWHDTAPDSKIEETSVSKKYIINDNITISSNTAESEVLTGAIDFYILWSPIRDGGDVN